MFFNFYSKTKQHKRDLVDIFYQKIIDVSRNKVFYSKFNVPDTLDGRYDLLALFSIILTFSLSRTGEKGIELSQILFDRIFLDLDLSLREMGAGDAGVHIKIKDMIKSYMGRQKSYCNCFETNDFFKLKKSLINNVYRNVDQLSDEPEKLTKYCKICVYEFRNKNVDYFLSKKFCFPKVNEFSLNQN